MRRRPGGEVTEAPPRPVDVVVHVGMGKTGTSSIQSFLGKNRDHLAERGVLYPRTPGAVRHDRLGLFLKSDEDLQASPEWHRMRFSEPTRFRRAFRRKLLAEIDAGGLSTALLSDEILFGSPDDVLRRLGRLAGRMGRSTRLVVYLRRQDDHAVSRYQQGVKIGWVQRLDRWMTEDMSSLYDYHARLRRHQRFVAPDAIVVRRYERGAFAAGSIFQDFLDAAGVDARAEELVQVADRNRSLDAESVELLRLLNLHRVENEGATPGLIDNRALVGRMTELASGPVLTLPTRALDAFMAQWSRSNRAVAREFLGDRKGELFRVARKESGTTTEQRLDPARLDHLFEQLGIPEEIHGAVRRIAEREATTT